jgi:hypothetical protein
MSTRSMEDDMPEHPMPRRLIIAIAASFLVACSLLASAAQSPASSGLPRGQVPTLGRPTDPALDAVPIFNFDQYFPGTWTFDDWDVPDTLLGPGGTFVGKTVYKHLDGKFYQATTQADGAGKLNLTETFAYEKDNKAIARHVVDARGFSYLQIGPVGADLGGYFNVHLESQPFSYKGKSIRMSSWMRLLSPVQYKNVMTISIDGGPDVNYGTAWWHKQVPGLAPQ